jgi:hypothetical protein
MSTTTAAFEISFPAATLTARLASAWDSLVGLVLPRVESWTLELTQDEVDADLRNGYGSDRE